MNVRVQLSVLKSKGLAKDRDDEREILERGLYGKLHEMLTGMTVATGPKGVKADTKITSAMLEELPRSNWAQIAVKNDNRQKAIEAQIANFESSIKALENRFNDKVDKLQRGDELLPGVMKMVKGFRSRQKKAPAWR